MAAGLQYLGREQVRPDFAKSEAVFCYQNGKQTIATQFSLVSLPSFVSCGRQL
jgi:hypothetical protein